MSEHKIEFSHAFLKQRSGDTSNTKKECALCSLIAMMDHARGLDPDSIQPDARARLFGELEDLIEYDLYHQLNDQFDLELMRKPTSEETNDK